MGNVRAAEDWPSWTDEDRWVPTEADAEWAAKQNETWDAEDGPDPDDPIWEEWAQESVTVTHHELGLRLY